MCNLPTLNYRAIQCSSVWFVCAQVAPVHPSLVASDKKLPQSFAELRLHSKVVDSLSEMCLVQPTAIQVS